VICVPEPVTATPRAELGDEISTLLLGLLEATSPNPPGDVSAAVAVVTGFCERVGLPYRLDSSAARRTNIIIDVHTCTQGRHLIWNGHLDTFPAVEAPLPPRIRNGRVHGRGAVDMKGGVAAFLIAAKQLHDDPRALNGHLSLVLVCDEETFGPHGTRSLLTRRPHLHGDAMISTEPSSLGLLRIAERGLLWLRITFSGTSLHAAYPDTGEGAILRMAAMLQATQDHVDRVNASLPDAESELPGDKVLDQHLGPGAARITRSMSFNVGTVRGGTAVNMKPDFCEVSLDLRLPASVNVDRLLEQVTNIAHRHTGTVEVLSMGAANSTADDEDVVRAVASAAEVVLGTRPSPSTGIGCTDARLWRAAGIPACVIGPDPATMGSVDEFVELAELEQLAAILVRATRTYLQDTSGDGTAA
jgi:succinyl-diaminopimelate desuccinylase